MALRIVTTMTHSTPPHSPFFTAARARLTGAIASIAMASALGLIGPVAASAQTAVAPKQVTAQDVATAPVDEFNLRKHTYAQALIDAKAHPYSLPGGGSCAAINHEVASLNGALGPDIDETASLTEQEKRSQAAGGTAQSVVGGLIPFGGVIRAISGASAEERRKQLLLYAGSVRRAYMKGYAHARGCRIAHYVAPPAEKK